MQYVRIILMVAGIFVFDVYSKEYYLYVANESGKDLKLQLFDIWHTIPKGERRKFIAQKCWGEIKSKGQGMAVLFSDNKFISHAYALIDGKRISLIEDNKICEQEYYALVQKYVHLGKDATDMMKQRNIQEVLFNSYEIKDKNIVPFAENIRFFIGNKEIKLR